MPSRLKTFWVCLSGWNCPRKYSSYVGSALAVVSPLALNLFESVRSWLTAFWSSPVLCAQSRFLREGCFSLLLWLLCKATKKSLSNTGHDVSFCEASPRMLCCGVLCVVCCVAWQKSRVIRACPATICSFRVKARKGVNKISKNLLVCFD